MSNVNIIFYLLWTLWQGNICYTHRWRSRKRKAKHMFMLFSCCCGISSHSQPSSWCKLSPQES